MRRQEEVSHILGVDLKVKLRKMLAEYMWNKTYSLIDGVDTFTILKRPFGGSFKFEWKGHIFYVDDDTFSVVRDVLKALED